MSRTLRALALLVTFSSCAPAVWIQRRAPARFNLGVSRRIALVETEGHRHTAQLLQDQLTRQVMAGGQLELFDAIDRGPRLVINLGMGRVDIAQMREAVPADLYLVMRVMESDLRPESFKTKDSKTQREVVKMRLVDRMNVTFQLVKADGRVVVYEDYRGENNGTEYPAGGTPPDGDQLEAETARQLVARFLGDITPRWVRERIILDETPPSLKPGVDLAKDGDLDGAERVFRGELERNPNSPGANYNLGVVMEAKGDFEQAEALYTKAFQLLPKDLYRDAIDDLHRRLGDAAALNKRI